MSATSNSVKTNGEMALTRAKPSVLDGMRIDDYLLIRSIGVGNYSKVMLGKNVNNGDEVAVKVISKSRFDSEYLDKFYREAWIMKSLNHPNILKLINVIDTLPFIYLVIEYAPGGDLYDYLQNHGCLIEKEARAMLRQIISAIEYCHGNNIVHRDLKPENILLDSGMNIKLADFGLSAVFTPENKLSSLCGSLKYTAPELFRGEKYGFEVDVWAIGILMYFLLTKTVPFKGETFRDVKSQVLRCSYEVPHHLSRSCKNLLEKILVLETASRPNLRSIMQDPWLNDGYSIVLKPYVET